MTRLSFSFLWLPISHSAIAFSSSRKNKPNPNPISSLVWAPFVPWLLDCGVFSVPLLSNRRVGPQATSSANTPHFRSSRWSVPCDRHTLCDREDTATSSTCSTRQPAGACTSLPRLLQSCFLSRFPPPSHTRYYLTTTQSVSGALREMGREGKWSQSVETPAPRPSGSI